MTPRTKLRQKNNWALVFNIEIYSCYDRISTLSVFTQVKTGENWWLGHQKRYCGLILRGVQWCPSDIRRNFWYPPNIGNFLFVIIILGVVDSKGMWITSFFPPFILWGWWSSDHPQEDSIKFGYYLEKIAWKNCNYCYVLKAC